MKKEKKQIQIYLGGYWAVEGHMDRPGEVDEK